MGENGWDEVNLWCRRIIFLFYDWWPALKALQRMANGYCCFVHLVFLLKNIFNFPIQLGSFGSHLPGRICGYFTQSDLWTAIDLNRSFATSTHLTKEEVRGKWNSSWHRSSGLFKGRWSDWCFDAKWLKCCFTWNNCLTSQATNYSWHWWHRSDWQFVVTLKFWGMPFNYLFMLLITAESWDRWYRIAVFI